MVVILIKEKKTHLSHIQDKLKELYTLEQKCVVVNKYLINTVEERL